MPTDGAVEILPGANYMRDNAEQSESTVTNRTTNGKDRFSHDQTPMTDGGRWLSDTPVLESTLPEDVQRLLGRLLGDEPVETLAEWVDEVRRRTGGGEITIEELCHTGPMSPHRAEVGDDVYHFRCFYDAVILAALLDVPVDIQTESPSGKRIEASAVGTDELHVTPSDAVFSFGVAESVEPPGDEGPSNADVYAAVCPYVQAFPDADAYHQWARAVPAATVVLPLEGATDVAARLVE
jgi:hypothetical protein